MVPRKTSQCIRCLYEEQHCFLFLMLHFMPVSSKPQRQQGRTATWLSTGFGGGVVFLNARNFSTCPWMRILFITEIVVSFWGVRLVDIPSIKSRRVQILGNSPCYKSTSLESSV